MVDVLGEGALSIGCEIFYTGKLLPVRQGSRYELWANKPSIEEPTATMSVS
jgi:hypothetical protein